MKNHMKKLEKDTYGVRKAEGRPKHGQTSFTILALGAISWLFVLIAIVLPEWRTNWIGMLGYPHQRSWGLFHVKGKTTKMHHEHRNDACHFYTMNSPMGACMTPICQWYRLKCQVYLDMTMVNYSSGFFLFLCLIMHTLCIVWTLKMTPRMIRWAATWWFGIIIIHITILMFWVMMTSESFNSLDSKSMYPDPDFSFSFYMECFSLMLLMVNAMMGLTLLKMWPESSGSSGDTSSSSGSDEDSDEPQGHPQQQGGYPPQQNYPPQQGAYPPPGYGPPGAMPPGMMGAPMGGPMGAPMMGGPPMGDFGQPMMQQYQG